MLDRSLCDRKVVVADVAISDSVKSFEGSGWITFLLLFRSMSFFGFLPFGRLLLDFVFGTTVKSFALLLVSPGFALI